MVTATCSSFLESSNCMLIIAHCLNILNTVVFFKVTTTNIIIESTIKAFLFLDAHVQINLVSVDKWN